MNRRDLEALKEWTLALAVTLGTAWLVWALLHAIRMGL